LPKNVRFADPKLQKMVCGMHYVFLFFFPFHINNKQQPSPQAGARCVLLHGCIRQDCKKVWAPGDLGDVCDKCGEQRYDEKGNPKLFVVHFPLGERIESLLQLQQYQEAVRHENRRKVGNQDYISGVYL
jgi:hypothetical protein